MTPTLMTAKEVAEYLRIPLPTVYYLKNEGKIPVIAIGGRFRFRKDLIDSNILGLDSDQPSSASELEQAWNRASQTDRANLINAHATIK